MYLRKSEKWLIIGVKQGKMLIVGEKKETES